MIQYRRGFIPLISILLLSIPAIAQEKQDSTNRFRVRNIAWFTPSGANQINGIAVGIQAMNLKRGAVEINGVNAEAGIIGVILLPYFIAENLSKPSKRRMVFFPPDSCANQVNGLNLTIGGSLEFSFNGLNLSGGITAAGAVNGVSVTGLFSRIHTFKGIAVSGLHNMAVKGRGLQIGLFNNCADLKGLQIGLWNKNGKRNLPIINWGL